MRRPANERGAAGRGCKEKQLRTCLGCGVKDRQERLLPLALHEAGRVVADEGRRLSGRHAYCCRNATCLARLLRNKKRIARALRATAVDFDEGFTISSGVSHEESESL
ncbi:MAG: YlxR family protein [Thermodesulfobacteriota bacterium]